MHIIRREGEGFQKEKLKFKPVRKIRALNNNFYFQSLSYDGNDLFIEVPFFQANGMSHSSYTNMLQMRVMFPKWQQELLCTLDGAAREHVKCPQDASTSWNKSFEDGSAYRNMVDPHTLYLKLSDNFQAFDVFKNTIDCDELKRGQYMALIHVTGIYIGGHGPTGKLAFFQMKLTQLLYQPIPHDVCFIEFKMPEPVLKTVENDSKSKDSSASKKRVRRQTGDGSPVKLKLKRANAQADLSKQFQPQTFDEETQSF